MIDVINKLIGEAEVEIRKVVKESEDGQRLLSAPGIGFILAYLILVEVGDMRSIHTNFPFFLSQEAFQLCGVGSLCSPKWSKELSWAYK